MYNILNSVQDEPEVLKKLSENIKSYTNMTEKELQDKIKGIDKGLQKLEQKKEFIFDVYNEKDCSELVIISDDGKTIKSSDEPNFIIEDESLKEKIFSQLYFQEKQYSKEKKEYFNTNVKNICDNIEQDSILNFANERDSIEKKKVFSAMKVSARENGYMILNSLEECENGNDIDLKAVKIPEDKSIDFEDLKKIYKEFEIDYKDKNWTQMYVKDRNTGKEITDPQIEKMAKFASVWVGAAGTKWIADEELHGITYAFNEPSERIYNQLGELISNNMTETGMINTEAIYQTLSNDKYKHSEEIIRNLLMNRGSLKIVYDFYKMQNKDARLETRLSTSAMEFVMGVNREDLLKSEVEDIMQSIPDELETTDSSWERSGQGLKQEFGISQAQAEQLKKEQEAQQRRKNEEQKRREEKENEIKIANEKSSQNDKIKGKDVQKDIAESKITMLETQEQTQNMSNILEMKALQLRKQLGQQLTAEQEQMLNSYRMQRAEQREKRNQNKGNKMSHEMGR